ncbi:hypothetical protein ANCDUO_13528 [Ancylostoma duodenale]|uniref:Uncharacterized protein n=1 Tax=Ancylostoma duodenale TaxID=51022 RepID=A0A0C2GGS0_9BILA|nr:hypothetical protein ANCDUO_13528 [Ancylostoma duodenale]
MGKLRLPCIIGVAGGPASGKATRRNRSQESDAFIHKAAPGCGKDHVRGQTASRKTTSGTTVILAPANLMSLELECVIFCPSIVVVHLVIGVTQELVGR